MRKLTLFWFLWLPIFLIAQEIDPQLIENDSEQTHILTTTNGDRWVGVLISSDDKQLTFNAVHVGTLVFDRSEVESVFLESHSRLLEQQLRQSYVIHSMAYGLNYMPTAFNFPKGSGGYRNTDLLYNVADFAFNDHFSAGVGAVIPGVATIRAKGGGKVTDKLHLGGYASSWIPFFDTGDWFLHTAVLLTIGQEQNFINLAPGLIFQPDRNDDALFAIDIGGSMMLNDRWRLYTEIGFFNDGFENIFLPSLGASLFTHRLRFDFGLLTVSDGFGVFPVPLVSLDVPFK